MAGSGGDVLISENHLKEAQTIFFQMASAIYYLHKCAMIAHRNLNPDNFLVFKNGKVKLADFGSAIRCGLLLHFVFNRQNFLLTNIKKNI
jgi:serine/threonine protein kinase